jgi:DNA polymerase, archaea type
LPYEALLANGREHWSVGERVYIYRRTQGRAGLWQADESAADADAVTGTSEARSPTDPRDYDAEHYVRQLRENFASRLARGLAQEDFEAIVADPDRPSLFERSLRGAQPILAVLQQP